MALLSRADACRAVPVMASCMIVRPLIASLSSWHRCQSFLPFSYENCDVCWRVVDPHQRRNPPQAQADGRDRWLATFWHILKIYSSFSIHEFVVCCDDKSCVIKEYLSATSSTCVMRPSSCATIRRRCIRKIPSPGRSSSSIPAKLPEQVVAASGCRADVEPR